MILIADSGSTKTDWCLCKKGTVLCSIQTQGINPYHQSEEAIEAVLREELLPQLTQHSAFNIQNTIDIVFYGSGCANENACNRIKKAIHKVLETKDITVHSDLLGAARALCGHEEGIACVLGTGSNSCLYNGKEITANTPPLGYILGDEGSGAVLGKILLGDVLKNQLPADLCQKFLKEFDLDRLTIIKRVYKEPQANRFLASVTPFLIQNIDRVEVYTLVLNAFKAFFVRNIQQYENYDKLSVNFIGSIAFYYRDVLSQAARECGCTVGNIIKSPMEGLIRFHA